MFILIAHPKADVYRDRKTKKMNICIQFHPKGVVISLGRVWVIKVFRNVAPSKSQIVKQTGLKSLHVGQRSDVPIGISQREFIIKPQRGNLLPI